MAQQSLEHQSQQSILTGLVNLLQSRRRQDLILKSVVYLLLLIGAFGVMLPFFWMISTSLKKPGTEFTFPIEWIPVPAPLRQLLDRVVDPSLQPVAGQHRPHHRAVDYRAHRLLRNCRLRLCPHPLPGP